MLSKWNPQIQCYAVCSIGKGLGLILVCLWGLGEGTAGA